VTVGHFYMAANNIQSGDAIVWEVNRDGTASVRRVDALDGQYLRALEATLAEWNGAEDEAAYRDL